VPVLLSAFLFDSIEFPGLVVTWQVSSEGFDVVSAALCTNTCFVASEEADPFSDAVVRMRSRIELALLEKPAYGTLEK